MKIDEPDFSLADIYEKCINNYRDKSKTTLMRSIFPDLEADESRYQDELIKDGLYFEKTKITHNNAVYAKDLINLYNQKLLNKNLGARVYYDKIIASSDLCPYCASRSVSTVDHYLSKSNYPNFSITPLNLVPCCADCNSAKDANDDSIEYKNQLLFHPYKDSLNEFKWLDACVSIENGILYFNFYITNEFIDNDTYKRAKNYIEILGLDEYYSKRANINFTRDKKYYRELYDKKAEQDELLKYFDNQKYVGSKHEHGKNSEQYVYYDALIKYYDKVKEILCM